MRLAAVAKCGYYPASPVAMDGIVKHLRLAEAKRESQYILDPCAGEGLAIKAIADGLGVPHDHTYCVEIDAGRSQQIKANLPGVNLLGPATFMGVQCSGWSFGLAYVNAPFDDELGGGRREEQAFVQKATNLLAPRGIIVIVCPISKFIGNRSFVQFVDANFDSLHVYRFPDGHRPYNEIVVFGRKRKTPIPADALDEHGELHQREWQWRSYVRIENLPPLGSVQPRHWDGDSPSSDRHSDLHVWEIPHGWKPATWKKTGFTEEELAQALAASPLNAHFKDVAPLRLKRPPLPLDKGHLGLILASGMLDGVVETPHGPHVVRGSSTKVEYHNKAASTSEENPETGAVTTKEVFSQRLVTVIRCVTPDGTIHTFSNNPQDETQGVDASIDEEAA